MRSPRRRPHSPSTPPSCVGPTGRACALSNNMALPIIADEHYVLVAGAAGERDGRGWETDLLAGLGLAAAATR